MFQRLIGNERAKETLRRMLLAERVPGALCLPVKRASAKLFALELAKALLCRAPKILKAVIAAHRARA
jgi:hypothetical protein